MKSKTLFKNSRRIRLGIWGLGRGRAFYQTLKALPFDIVAGCDFNDSMRNHFLEFNPRASVTNNSEEFLQGNFDAVLLATFCPNHAEDAIRCLEAGKHVLSEVTAFHTPAEGVRLVETVEKTGLVYNLAENYPFSAPNMYLQRRWEEGLFGDFLHGEYEYMHEIASLSYSYLTGEPIQPGYQPHNWRSWLNFHYYNTHSLGPVMFITGARPTVATAFASDISFPGLLRLPWLTQPCVSLIKMSNGGLMRNLIGYTGNDTSLQRLYGTLGGSEISGWSKLRIRLGGRGESPQTEVNPTWREMAKVAGSSGHGGGDFWVCYYFARQILEGKSAPFDVYRASDCTLQGIQSYRSCTLNGQPTEIPDFRDAKIRRKYADDHFAQPRLDVREGLFGKNPEERDLGGFNALMLEILDYSSRYRAWKSWTQIREDVSNPLPISHVAAALETVLPAYRRAIQKARKIIQDYQGTLGADTLQTVLEGVGNCDHVLSRGIGRELRDSSFDLQRRARRKKWAEDDARCRETMASAFVKKWTTLSVSTPFRAISSCSFPPRGQWKRAKHYESNDLVVYAKRAGETSGGGTHWFRTRFVAEKSGSFELRIGHDAPAIVFFDQKKVKVLATALPEAKADRFVFRRTLEQGVRYEVLLALDGSIEVPQCVSLRFAPSRAPRQQGTYPKSI